VLSSPEAMPASPSRTPAKAPIDTGMKAQAVAMPQLVLPAVEGGPEAGLAPAPMKAGRM
jgi:hypothetical protein